MTQLIKKIVLNMFIPVLDILVMLKKKKSLNMCIQDSLIKISISGVWSYIIEKMYILKMDKFALWVEDNFKPIIEITWISKGSIGLGLYSQIQASVNIARDIQYKFYDLNTANIYVLNQLDEKMLRDKFHFLLELHRNNLNIYITLHNNYYKNIDGHKLYNNPPNGNISYNWTDIHGNIQSVSENITITLDRITLLESQLKTINTKEELISFTQLNLIEIQKFYGNLYTFDHTFTSIVYGDHNTFLEFLLSSIYIYWYYFNIYIVGFILLHIIVVNSFFLLLYLYEFFKKF